MKHKIVIVIALVGAFSILGVSAGIAQSADTRGPMGVGGGATGGPGESPGLPGGNMGVAPGAGSMGSSSDMDRGVRTYPAPSASDEVVVPERGDSYYRDRQYRDQYRDRAVEPDTGVRTYPDTRVAPPTDTREMDRPTYDDRTGRFPGRGQGIEPGRTIVPRAGEGDLRERTVPDTSGDRMLEDRDYYSRERVPEAKNPAYK